MDRLCRGLAMLVVGSVVLVGCGGGDEKVSSSSPVTTVDVPTSKIEGGGRSGDLSAADCVAATTTLAEVYGSVAQAVANLDAGLREKLGALEGYADKAPSDIRADLRIVTDVFADAIEAQSNVNIPAVAAGASPPPDVVDKLRASVEQLGSTEFTEAAARVSNWLTTACGR